MQHVPASDAARAFFKPAQDSVNRYGEELATEFAVLRGLQGTLGDFADIATEKAETYRDAQDISHTFETLWAMLDEKFDLLTKEIDKRREERLQR